MKYNLTLTTLTPVHIGSGNVYKKHIDFEIKSNEKSLYIFDYNKFPSFLNVSQINLLSSFIENNESFLNLFPNNFDLNLISKRKISCSHSSLNASDFHEFITDARYQPYIPGSSIKGFIITPFILKHINTTQPDELFNLIKTINKENKVIFKHDKLLKIREHQTHFSRFIKISDAYFPPGSTFIDEIQTVVATNSDDWEKRPNLKNLAELIPANLSASFTISLPQSENDFIHPDVLNKISSIIPSPYQPYFPPNIHQLFTILNEHTLRILNKETELLESTNEPFSENYEKTINNLINNITQLLENPEPNTAIIRIGKFTGFNNLTGHWQDDKLSDEHYNELIKYLNKNHSAPFYPKSRRFTSEGLPLGFIKIQSHG